MRLHGPERRSASMRAVLLGRQDSNASAPVAEVARLREAARPEVWRLRLQVSFFLANVVLALTATGFVQAGEPAALPRDRFGDALPPGAKARLGTVRWRHQASISALVFAPQGQGLV